MFLKPERTFAVPTDDAIEPFHIDIPQSALDDLQLRLGLTRLPDAIPGSGWDYGIDMDYLRDLLGYWRTGYDWRAAEARLNALDHFRTRIDGHLVHFIHARSPHADATPVLMVHGWPGSIVEFLGVVERLTTPEKFGGRPQDAVHLVMPSLPGYGFSEAPRERGWGPGRMGAVFAQLMARLGYDRYGVQGGDWGAIIVAEMALADTGHIIGLHTNMPVAARPPGELDLTPAEQVDVAEAKAFAENGRGYAIQQGTKPQTLGVALNDSPAGLCAWIVEKFHGWTDRGGGQAPAIDRDLMLTNVMIYWLTGTATSSARLYYERTQAGAALEKDWIGIPTGVARFPRELRRPPRAWVERHFNVVRWTEMAHGGHFGALEQPVAFADDVLAFFGALKA